MKIRSRGSTDEGSRLLLHVCCAPCASVPWPELMAEGFDVVAYFYGGNIHPREEYEARLESVLRLAEKIEGRVIVRDYDPGPWRKAASGFEDEPEGGSRCPVSFGLQLEAAAAVARSEGCCSFCTTLTISPQKDPGLINSIGRSVAERYGLVWENRIWRKRGGFVRSVAESRRLGLYRQSYCGCMFSMRGDDRSEK